MSQPVHVIGGGLAGRRGRLAAGAGGIPVILHEMRPARTTAAHKTGTLAELVCSNSFRSDDSLHNAVGLLHEEMRRCGSLSCARPMRTSCRRAARSRSIATVLPRTVQDSAAAEMLVEIRREAVPACPMRPPAT